MLHCAPQNGYIGRPEQSGGNAVWVFPAFCSLRSGCCHDVAAIRPIPTTWKRRSSRRARMSRQLEMDTCRVRNDLTRLEVALESGIRECDCASRSATSDDERVARAAFH